MEGIERNDGEELSQVELHLIDFENAVLFNSLIPSEFVKAIVKSCDYRYPFKSGDMRLEDQIDC